MNSVGKIIPPDRSPSTSPRPVACVITGKSHGRTFTVSTEDLSLLNSLNIPIPSLTGGSASISTHSPLLGEKFIGGMKSRHLNGDRSPPSDDSPSSSPEGASHNFPIGVVAKRGRSFLERAVIKFFKRENDSLENDEQKECCDTEKVRVISLEEEKESQEPPLHEKIRDEWLTSEKKFFRHLEILHAAKEELDSLDHNFFDCVKSSTCSLELKGIALEVLNQFLKEIERVKPVLYVLVQAMKQAQTFEKFVEIFAPLRFEFFNDVSKYYSIYKKTLATFEPSDRKQVLDCLNKLIISEEEFQLGFEGHANTIVKRLTQYSSFLGRLIKAIEKNPSFSKELKDLQLAHQRALEAQDSMNDKTVPLFIEDTNLIPAKSPSKE